MTVEQAKALIFTRLCVEHRRHQNGGLMPWRGLPEELGIPLNVFDGAMRELIDTSGGLIVERDGPDRIRLGFSGRWRCESGQGLH